jgi:hypothetical protein
MTWDNGILNQNVEFVLQKINKINPHMWNLKKNNMENTLL